MNSKKQIVRESVRRTAIEALESRQLMSAVVPSGYIPIGSVQNYNVKSSANASTDIVLKANRGYFLVAEGQHLIDKNGGSGARPADAQFYVEQGTGNWTSNGIRLKATGVESWGAFQPDDHVYGAAVAPATTARNLETSIRDSRYDDNKQGSPPMKLTVYEGPQPKVSVEVTDASGAENGRDALKFNFKRGTLSYNGTTTSDSNGAIDVYFHVTGDAVGSTVDQFDGISADGADYSGLPVAGELTTSGITYKFTIPDGSPSAELTLKPLYDNSAESVESVGIRLDSANFTASPYQPLALGETSAAGTITNQALEVYSPQPLPTHEPTAPELAALTNDLNALGAEASGFQGRAAAQANLMSAAYANRLLLDYYVSYRDNIVPSDRVEYSLRVDAISAAIAQSLRTECPYDVTPFVQNGQYMLHVESRVLPPPQDTARIRVHVYEDNAHARIGFEEGLYRDFAPTETGYDIDYVVPKDSGNSSLRLEIWYEKLTFDLSGGQSYDLIEKVIQDHDSTTITAS